MPSKDKKLGLFDLLNNINAGTGGPDMLSEVPADNSQGLPDPDSPEKVYAPFMINRGLSYFQDTVLLANEMNRVAHLPAKMQYDFLRNTVRPRRRFSKWLKAMDDSDDVKIIMEHYGYSAIKAREVLHLFDRDALDRLHAIHIKGGSV